MTPSAAELETIAQAAARKAVSVSFLRKLIRTKRWRVVHVPRARVVRLHIADVDALFVEMEDANPAVVREFRAVPD